MGRSLLMPRASGRIAYAAGSCAGTLRLSGSDVNGRLRSWEIKAIPAATYRNRPSSHRGRKGLTLYRVSSGAVRVRYGIFRAALVATLLAAKAGTMFGIA